ncbi:MAG: exo-alpha-sialidase [Paenibacillus sp.]|jgi:hypothetical protein|nr:exo-alpha-sialidase [Paenibacillus sp.]
MAIQVTRELYVEAPDRRTSEARTQSYVSGRGLKRVEHKSLAGESDWINAEYERFSDDNGRTWGEWQDVYGARFETKGEDEVMTYSGTEAYNPKYGHFVSVGMRRVFFDGHKKAYERFWKKGEAGFVDHSLMVVRRDGSPERSIELIRYEDGAEYDPDNCRDAAYTDHNRAYFGSGVDVLDNGDILFSICAAVRSCCRILGLDVNEVFPSCPDIMHGMIIVRGTFNETRGSYDLAYSRPIVISDLKSSRGVNEPTAIRLPSGRILAVFRGSNVSSAGWNTRIEPGTPAHKWYCYSDDGGQTFTDPVPWHFDDGEVFYSAATISSLVKSVKDGHIYWIGNISDHKTYGNYPRHPLFIVRINDRGLLMKETLTVIDKREEGDSELLQLSNFHILQDRETGRIELYLNKLGQRKEHTWWADCYRYFIDVG